MQQTPTLSAPPHRSKLLLATAVFSIVGGLIAMLLLWSAWRSRAAHGDGKALFDQQEVTFDAGANHLAGVLVRPKTKGPHAGVVFLGDGGPSDHTEQQTVPAVARRLAAHGFACLSWDRPGVGKSSGDWQTQTIADRADEALAALRFLQSRPNIRRDRVGLAGLGQGGIVAPAAAAQSRDVAFVVAIGSGQLIAWEQELYRVEHELRADGFKDAAVAEAMDLARLKVDVMRSDHPFEEFDETQKLRIARPWFKCMTYCNRDAFDAARRIINYDPAATWEKVHCPVLALFGDKDTTGPADASAVVIRQGVQKASNADVTIKIIPRADHLLTVSDTGGRKEAQERAKKRPAGERPELAPGYVETLTTWLVARFNAKR